MAVDPRVRSGPGGAGEPPPRGGASPGVRGRLPVRRILAEWTGILVTGVILFLGVRVFVVEAYRIPSGSMAPTLLPGDFLLVNKAVYGAHVPGTGLALPAFAEPRRGDVVVFRPPHDAERNYVKRVVGLPGDTLAMRHKILYVNGKAVEEPYVRHGDPGRDLFHSSMLWQRPYLVEGAGLRRPTRDNWGPLVVPPGKLFVLGDNRDNSEDSRFWGFVDRSAVLGRPWLVYFSLRGGEGRRSAWAREIRWDRIGGRVR